MHAFVDVNGIPTKVMTWGRWIEDKTITDNPEDIIICIPGNPGVTKFYTVFLQSLYQELQCPVWILSHAGHEVNKNSDNSALKLFGVEDQIKHKETFIKTYVPENSRIYLIGHSVGAHIVVELLKDPWIAQRVVSNYLLFPTVEKIADTPNGRFISHVFPFVPILTMLAWFISILPRKVQSGIINLFMHFRGIPKMHHKSISEFIHCTVIRQVFHFAKEEMEVIRERNNEVFSKFKSKIKLYYSASDGWAPVSFRDGIKRDYPDIDAEVCMRRIEHAFILKHSREMAKLVISWIKNSKKIEGN